MLGRVRLTIWVCGRRESGLGSGGKSGRLVDDSDDGGGDGRWKSCGVKRWKGVLRVC